ncbi:MULTISPECIES: glycosyltransferase family 4 protein [unclassified Lentimicrobium]|uniref:glycosyltransferase family 4 protein n=1 Tax=unclassified Lentimicrobium TaxID=2677434 RepID=UPI0015579ECB|nr:MULTISPECIES: glycosyltransferase family 4 protein [unclassified Lentimicrobium]NPD47589.1 glycosyltransferase family 4 protein [Lentimicrobium sp. S6]NPD83607.1 glycosyltransferase family 4 protein [Lentimicrobium sp. L6]
MKIGMILDSHFPPDPRVENEALSLIEAGHEIHLYCIDYSKKQKAEENIKGIHVHRVSPPTLLYKFSALAYDLPIYHLFFKQSLKKFIENTKIEAIHIHDLPIAKSVFDINKTFKLPITFDLHENRPEIMKFYSHTHSLLGKLLISPKRWKSGEYKYIKKADKVIVITNAAKDYYCKEMDVDPSKFYVVPNSVQSRFYTDYTIDANITEKYKGHYTLLYLGDTGLRRGLETAIKAMNNLILKIPNIKLVIVGKSRTDQILKNLINENHLENYVDFVGWQNFELFPSYILASNIGICPLHRNIHHDTTYANKIFQSLSFGKPIIVSDCTAQKDIAIDYECGLVFKDRDIDDYSAQVLKLYEQKDLYTKMSENAMVAIKEHLNWEVLSRDLKKIYPI